MSCFIDSNMVKISQWDDVTPFNRKIVAYMTDSRYLGDTENKFHLENSKVCFGYITEGYCTEPGYNLTRLWKPNVLHSNCVLVTSELACTLLMRLATKDEKEAIAQAIDRGQTTFNYSTKEESKRIINSGL